MILPRLAGSLSSPSKTQKPGFMPPNLRRGRERLLLRFFKIELSFFLVEGIVSISGDAGGCFFLCSGNPPPWTAW